MSEKLKIGDVVKGTFGEMEVIEDFLPSPEELLRRETEAEKVTLLLDRSTLAFFRAKAKMHGASYQRMIRELLKDYAELYKKQT